ncbi:MAG: SurA N-terminal domain-containing protein [Oligoflexia bacterium]|nr:SurA N-terminal domain-containing protein [Oligoflexia bacterium]
MTSTKTSMMSFWKKKSKKLAAHLVFWPIILVFAIFGFEKMGNPVGGAAAVVNGNSITVSEYRGTLQRMIDFYSQMTGGEFNEDAIKRFKVRETALQQLITSELVSQEAHKMGLKVTDAELTEIITNLAYFKKDEKFSREVYETVLKNNRLSSYQFETGLRKDTLVEKTRSFFSKNVYLSPLEKERLEKMQSQKINLEYLKITPALALDNMKVTSADIEKLKQQKDYQQKVKEYYDLNSRLFNTPEQVKAKHILVKAQKGNSSEEAKALEKIKKIQSELSKKSFSELAKKYSDDPGSKSNGGELNWFEKGRMVPEFEQAAFGLKIGEVSKPIQTQFGFHLIKVEAKKAAQNIPFSEATLKIEKALASQEKLQQAIREIENLISSNQTLAIEKIKKLDPKAKWQETGLFSVTEEVVPNLGGGDEVMKEALSLSSQKPISNKLLAAQDGYVVIKLKNTSDQKQATDKNKIAANLNTSHKDVFSSWVGRLNEKAKIDVNPKLFDGGVTSDSM